MKKEINDFFLLFLILFTSITTGSIILFYQNEYNGDGIKLIEQYPIPSSTVPFKVGYESNPYALDPVDTWDVASKNIQYQVVEGLVGYDYSTHPNYAIKDVLAESWVWDNETQITFTLRQGVQFHDGSLMTAEDVKWNFERVQYFINATGTLVDNATSWLASPSSVFFHYDGTPIFASFEANDAVDPYVFTIILSKPFGAALDLLCFGATDILSPESTPRYRYLDLATDDLIGTGPFEYDSFEVDVEVLFHAYSNYWRGEAQIKEMIWTIIEDDTTRMNAGLAGLFDYVGGVLKTYIDTFRADPDFHVEDVGEDLAYYYLEIYSGPRDITGAMIVPGDHQYQRNPAYLRRALALAVNYTYIYEEILAGYAVEGTTAVPRAMPGHNASVVQASDSSFTLAANVVKARQLLKDNAADIVARGGIDCSGFDVNNDGHWTGQNILGRDLEINRHSESSSNEGLNILLTDNYDMIGIQLFETIRDWGLYLNVGVNSPWEMDIAYIGWAPDYLNPFNMIDPLFNLDSSSCFSRINDTSAGGLTELMNAAAIETDYSTQLDYYMKIQSLIYDVNRPLNPASHCHISTWVYLVHQVHKAELENFSYNVKHILDLYSVEWGPSNGYWIVEPLIIDGSGTDGYTWSQISVLEWCSGFGTFSNPYIIENIVINGENSISCIEIKNSDVYLQIRNSTFSNSGSGTSDAGIKLVSVTAPRTKLYNVNCSDNNGYGIYLSNCQNVYIRDSTMNNNGRDGIALFNSDSNYIENNNDTINSNSGNGIYLSSSNYNEISWNVINLNTYGIYFDGSSYNTIQYNNLQYNSEEAVYQTPDSSGNEFFENTPLIGGGGQPPPNWVIIIIIACIIALVAVSGAIVLKKRSSGPKKVKEKKTEMSLEGRTALTILKEEKRREKQKHKVEEKERKIESDLLNRMSTVDFLIKENKIEIAIKSLVKIQEEAQTQKLEHIVIKAQERIDLCQNLEDERIKQERLKEEERRLQERLKEEERLLEEKLKEEEKREQERLKEEERLEKERLKEEEKSKKERLKEEERMERERLEKEKERQRIMEKKILIKEEFQKRITNVDHLIKENKAEMAIKILLGIQKEAQAQDLGDIVNKAEEKIIECKKSEVETDNRIKQTILTLGAKFTRLQLLDISEKSGIQDEALIENIIQDMIRNKEIQGEYFSSSKALALEVVTPVPVEEKAGKHNVFISYSTLDTDYFQVSKIVRRLELYPEIKKVLFWEADSKQNIVEFMEETLRKTNAFILFCSENSIKSEAVKSEWQSAYQMVKKGLMKMIPVYEDEDHIPRLLWQMLNVKFTPDDFEGFIQKLYGEILR